MRRNLKPAKPSGVVILQQVERTEWIFNLPRVDEEVRDQLEAGINWLNAEPSRAARIFRKLIAEYPEHMDACHHLGLALDRMGKDEEAFEIRARAVKTALQFFPAHFSMKKDRLQWGFVENRPFLRLYQSYGWQLMKRGQVEEALAVSENILTLNPNDNQGVRALVVGCCLALHRPDGVLSLCRRYRGDALEHVVYGKALALFQLGRLKQASKALEMAIKCFPLIAAELLKPKHRKPKDADARYVTMGSPQQAHLYWKEHGRYWAKTAGTIGFLTGHLPGKRQAG